MDQHAFRQLLGTPRQGDGGGRNVAGGASSSAAASSSSLAAPASTRSFGKQAKRGGPLAASSSVSSAMHDLMPRKVGDVPGSRTGKDRHGNSAAATAQPKKNAFGEAYVDRAEARRLGKEGVDEFENVDRLREDFERRIREAPNDEERTKLREQMAFLGGDAKHSVLVKGLDFALLEQQKAKLSGNVSGDTDDALEAAYSRTSHSEVHVPQRANRPPPSRGPDKASAKKSNFRPIGQSTGAGTGFQPINATKVEDSPDYIWRDGKRYRKKKKDKHEKGSVAETSADSNDLHDSASSARPTVGRDTLLPQPATEKREMAQPAEDETKVTSSPTRNKNGPSTLGKENEEQSGASRQGALHNVGTSDEVTSARSSETHASEARVGQAKDLMKQDSPATNDDEDDEDIFAGAGRWQAEESDEEGANDSPRPRDDSEAIAIGPTEIKSSRDWFSSSHSKAAIDASRPIAGSADTSSQISSILAQAHGSDYTPVQPFNSRAQDDEEGREGADERQTTSSDAQASRLVGLSDSALGAHDIRALLESERRERQDRSNNGASGKQGASRRKRKKRGQGGDDSD